MAKKKLKWNNNIDKIIAHPELLSKFRKILLVGPTGTGKTTAVDTLIKKTNYIKTVFGPKNISPKMGQTELNIISVFSTGGSDNIIVVDEVDSFVTDRYKQNDTAGINKTYASITNAFLMGMDQMQTGISMIAMTNHAEVLDEAFTRRFDLIIEFKDKFEGNYLKNFYRDMLIEYDVNESQINWENKKPYEIESQIKQLYIENFKGEEK